MSGQEEVRRRVVEARESLEAVVSSVRDALQEKAAIAAAGVATGGSAGSGSDGTTLGGAGDGGMGSASNASNHEGVLTGTLRAANVLTPTVMVGGNEDGETRGAIQGISMEAVLRIRVGIEDLRSKVSLVLRQREAGLHRISKYEDFSPAEIEALENEESRLQHEVRRKNQQLHALIRQLRTIHRDTGYLLESLSGKEK
mmetsp:Transcript_2562/g.4516  ORF Transcript_2562/g.4516 Transcript_2562/m.4516 type:complete len:199 (-) Transcript_2562:1278-1874(-)